MDTLFRLQSREGREAMSWHEVQKKKLFDDYSSGKISEDKFNEMTAALEAALDKLYGNNGEKRIAKNESVNMPKKLRKILDEFVFVSGVLLVSYVCIYVIIGYSEIIEYVTGIIIVFIIDIVIISYISKKEPARISCHKCSNLAYRGKYATWQIVLSVVLFPIGLLSLLAGRGTNECRECGYIWNS